MFAITVVSLVTTAALAVVQTMFPHAVILALAITVGTVFYHFAMRLAVGGVIHAVFHNRMDHRKRWFTPKRFEAGLYRCLRVARWKSVLPTFAPQSFDLREHTWEELIGATCQAEIVHEVIMILSFVPLVGMIRFGEFGVFLATSIVACLFDGMFVVVQRFNRPRLVKIAERQIKKQMENTESV